MVVGISPVVALCCFLALRLGFGALGLLVSLEFALEIPATGFKRVELLSLAPTAYIATKHRSCTLAQLGLLGAWQASSCVATPPILL